ncbi:MAG: ferredoxin--NADP reductase [Saprospiraceae bacterium]
MTTWLQGKVVNILQESPSVKRFFIEIPAVNCFNFKAGQFVTFDLPVGEKRLQRWRSYSIANAPNNGNVIELCIVKVEMGLASTYFFQKVAIGTILKFKGPEGTFCLPEIVDHDTVMICTGTGVAPFRSIINDVLDKGFVINLHLIFGCRTVADILYRAEFEELARKNVNFTYDVCLSREKVADLYFGYVHDVYMSKYKDAKANTRFYICGWNKMIDETVENLIVKMGCSRSQVLYELYG